MERIEYNRKQKKVSFWIGCPAAEVRKGRRQTVPMKVLPREKVPRWGPWPQWGGNKLWAWSAAGAHSRVFQLLVLSPHTKPFCHNNVVSKGRYSIGRERQKLGFLSMCFNLSLKEEIRILAYPQSSWSLGTWVSIPRVHYCFEQRQELFLEFGSLMVRPWTMWNLQRSGHFWSVCQSNFSYLNIPSFKFQLELIDLFSYPPDRHSFLSLLGHILCLILYLLLL